MNIFDFTMMSVFSSPFGAVLRVVFGNKLDVVSTLNGQI